MPFSAPAERMHELVRLLRAAFAAQKGGGFRWDGKHWQLSVPIYSRPGAARAQIPIWVAAVNRGMIAAAGAVADGLVGHPIATRRWHREVTLPGLRAAESAAGREAGACALAPYVVTSIQRNRDDAVRDAKCQIGFYFTTELYHSILDLHGLRDVGAGLPRRAAQVRREGDGRRRARLARRGDRDRLHARRGAASASSSGASSPTSRCSTPRRSASRPSACARTSTLCSTCSARPHEVNSVSEEAPAARIPILSHWEAAQIPASGAWAQKRRLAAAMRLVIERLVESNAPENELAARRRRPRALRRAPRHAPAPAPARGLRRDRHRRRRRGLLRPEPRDRALEPARAADLGAPQRRAQRRGARALRRRLRRAAGLRARRLGRRGLRRGARLRAVARRAAPASRARSPCATASPRRSTPICVSRCA